MISVHSLFLLGVLALALAWLFLYPLPLALSDALPYNLGDPLLNAWIIGWTSERLLHGLSGVWDAPAFFPYDDSLAYSEHLLGVTLLVAPVYWLTGNGILAHNVAILLSFAVATISMFLLAHALTGRRDASVVAALAFAFSPFRLGGQLARVQVMMSCWLPLALWGLHRYGATGRPRYLAAATASYLLMALSNTYLIYYSAPAFVLIVLVIVLRSRLRTARALAHFAVAATAVAVVLAPIATRYREVQRDHGFERPVEEVTTYSADVLSYITVSPRSPLARWLPSDGTADRALFPGLALMLLALVGLAGALRRRASEHATSDSFPAVAVYSTAAAVSALLSFGPLLVVNKEPTTVAGPYGWLMAMVPGLDGFRAPGRFGIVVMVACGVLAAFGAARLLAGRGTAVRTMLTAGVALLVVIEAFPGPLPLASFRYALTPGQERAYEWLGQVPAAGVLVLPADLGSAKGFEGAGVTPNLVYQYAGLEHDLPLVNGTSGFIPPLTAALSGADSPLVDPARVPDVLASLHALGVRYVVVHTRHYQDSDLAAGIVAAVRHAPLTTHEERFDDTWVFTLGGDAAAHDLTRRREPKDIPLTDMM